MDIFTRWVKTHLIVEWAFLLFMNAFALAALPFNWQAEGMKIDPLMNLEELAEHMGTDSLEEAAHMRELLLGQDRERTEEFSGQEWAELLIEAGKKV